MKQTAVGRTGDHIDFSGYLTAKFTAFVRIKTIFHRVEINKK